MAAIMPEIECRARTRRTRTRTLLVAIAAVACSNRCKLKRSDLNLLRAHGSVRRHDMRCPSSPQMSAPDSRAYK